MIAMKAPAKSPRDVKHRNRFSGKSRPGPSQLLPRPREASRDEGLATGIGHDLASNGHPGHEEWETPFPTAHFVFCPYCQHEFELFSATWCWHRESPPSKICPHCGQCLCLHQAYGDSQLWKESPPAFKRQGFQKLFLLYL